MISVFIGGSRHISQLNDSIRTRIQNIIDQNYIVLVGDANGSDKLVQGLLANTHYDHVVVYCAGEACRNNLGNWTTNHVDAFSKTNDFQFYAIKDKEMAKKADYGFMLWDGKSAGTLNNILNLLRLQKRILVYFSPEKLFVNVSTLSDLKDLLLKCDPMEMRKIDSKIHLKQSMATMASPEQVSLSI